MTVWSLLVRMFGTIAVPNLYHASGMRMHGLLLVRLRWFEFFNMDVCFMFYCILLRVLIMAAENVGEGGRASTGLLKGGLLKGKLWYI